MAMRLSLVLTAFAVCTVAVATPVKLGSLHQRQSRPTEQELQDAVIEGVNYFSNLCSTLQSNVDALVSALQSGQRDESVAAYVKSRPEYEQIEVLAPSFPDEDRDIDARPYAHEFGELDENYKGFHEVEYRLFRDNNLKLAADAANELNGTVQVLCGKLADTSLDEFNPENSWDGIIALAFEVPAKKISSEEETWSGLSLMIFRENFKGINSQVEPFLPLVGDDKLTQDFDAAKGRVTNVLNRADPEYGLEGGPNGEATPYVLTAMQTRKEISDAFNRYAVAISELRVALLGPAEETSSEGSRRLSVATRQETGETSHQEHVKEGVDYLADQCRKQQAALEPLVNAIEDGNLEQARENYRASRPMYEQIEVLAPSFPQKDQDIDARPYVFERGERDSEFRGFHVIEYLLFRDNNTEDAVPVVKELQGTVDSLCEDLNTVDPEAFNFANTWDGLIALAYEVPAKKISSEEETYSDLSILIYRENFKGINSQVEPFYGMLTSDNRDAVGGAYDEIVAAFNDIDQDHGFEGGNEGQARLYSTLTTSERDRIVVLAYQYASALSQARENLEQDQSNGDGSGGDGSGGQEDVAGDSEEPDSEEPDSEEPEAEPTPACFPSLARVVTEDLSTKLMSDLQVGDRVLTSSGFSAVYFFSHLDQDKVADFVSISASGLQEKFLASPGHYVHTYGGLKSAGAIVPGDKLVLGDLTLAEVRTVEMVSAIGLISPHTLKGNIVVDGVLASCYTTAVPIVLARLLLLPVRVLYLLNAPAITFLYKDGLLHNMVALLQPLRTK